MYFFVYCRKLNIIFDIIRVIVGRLYVYQIAVKKEYQGKGIGTELVERAKQLAHALCVDLSAHVRDYNINSQRTLEKCGFIKSVVHSTNDNYYYYYKTLNNDIGVSEKGLN